MEKHVLKLEFDVGTTSRSATGANEDVGKAMELVQRERDRDVKEKEELRSLNDRFAHFLANIEQLKKINEQLQAQLKDEFSKWGILPRDENELKQLINQINDRAVKRANDEVHSRAAEQESAILSRAATLYGNIQDMYKRKQENLRILIDRLQEELNRMLPRERLSEEEVSTTRNDLLKELEKFRQRLQDWLRIVVDKQTLLDDIQSLRERINLINALNDEEINEWKRLLDQSKDDSISFYREELTNAIRDIKRDYSKQAKKFQDELEYQIEGQLRMVENQLKQQVPGFGDSAMQESERNRIQMEETKLRASMEVIDNLFLNAFSFYSSRNMIKNKFD
jgi:biopolymer transport protein ExbB/TolQ